MWWIKYLRPKPSAEKALQTFADEAQAVLGTHLKSIMAFGSFASGEFHALHSNLNLLVVLDDVTYGILQAFQKPLEQWQRSGHPLPILLQTDELGIYARRFPIEFLDIQDHHRVIYGENIATKIQISRDFLRAQCEHDLTVQQLQLRQAIALKTDQSDRMIPLLRRSCSSVLTLFRAILRLQGEIPKMSKLEAGLELCRRLGLDGSILERIAVIHFRRSTDNLSDLAASYLDLIEKVLQHFQGH